MKNAIILCSGGLDSVTTAYGIKSSKKYNSISILFFNYGQRSLIAERKYSKLCAKKINAKFREIKIPELGRMSHSLINKPESFKKLKKKDLKNTKEESKNWYVPCRNTLFLSYALSYAESLFIQKKIVSDIFVGFKCEGSEHYPDTTQKYVNVFNNLSKISCAKPFKITAPLIKMDKEDIIGLALYLKINLKETFSCYTSKKYHCGDCLACQLRKSGFYWANIIDPTIYVKDS